MANRWRVGVSTAALLCVGLLVVLSSIPYATAQPAIGAQCADKQKALDDRKEVLEQLEWDLQELVATATQIIFKGTQTADSAAELSKLNNKRKELEPKIQAARDAVEKLQRELDACKPGVSPAAAREIHPFPVSACPRCDRDAKDAKIALARLIEDEAAVARARLRIFELKAWLSAHASDQNTQAYKDSARDLGSYESDLKQGNAERVEAQRDFDARMAALAKCNAAPDCKPRATTPPDRLPFYPLPEMKAKCADCDGPALKVEADIAQLRGAELRLALDQDRLRDLISTAKTREERKAIEKAEKDLESELKADEKAIADIAQVVAKDGNALADCNAKCLETTNGQNVPPGGAKTPLTPGGGTTQPVRPGGTPSGTIPGGPGGAGGAGAPPVTPPTGTPPPVTPGLPGSTTPPFPGPVPPLETKPMSAGGFVTPPSTFTFSLGPGFFIAKPISLAVYPANDSAVLRGPMRIDTIALNVGVSNFAPSWLPNYSFDFGAMDGKRSTSTQVPAGIQSGYVYDRTAANGSTGISSNGGLNVSLKTTFYDANFALTLPSQAIKDEDYSKIWLGRAVWARYARTRYDGMASILLNPAISSTTDQNTKEYDLGAGINLRGEHTFSNRFVGSIGIGADAIVYHANYDGTQVNVCPGCSAEEQNYNVSTNDSRNRFALGLSATAGLSYSVSNNAALFFRLKYGAEFGASTFVNKITPSDAGPQLSTGTRQFGSGLFGFSVKF